jgi:long-chain fatty acid transport protein
MGKHVLSLLASRRAALAAMLACGSAFGSGAAFGTGFFINQQSVMGLGRVDAGNSAAADELATIFFNPAGLSHFLGDNPAVHFAAGLHLIVPRSSQRDTGSTLTVFPNGSAGAPFTFPSGGVNDKNPTRPSPIPNLYLAKSLGGGAAVGLGVNVPFGLKAEFAKDWFGRYDATEASLRTINLSVVGSYRVPGAPLSIGGGIDFQYARSTLSAALPTASTDAQVSTRGHDYTPGFNVGLLYGDEKSRIGVHYRSRMVHDLRGSSEVSGFTGALEALNGERAARAELRLPAIATVGFRREIQPGLAVLGEFEWFDWSTFNEVRVRFPDTQNPDAIRETRYRDAYAIAFGAEYSTTWRNTYRGGLHYDTTPTTDRFRDTTVPDSQRLWLGLGASFGVGAKSYVDVAFNHVFFRKTRIDLDRPIPGVGAAHVSADVDSVVNTISIGYRSSF